MGEVVLKVLWYVRITHSRILPGLGICLWVISDYRSSSLHTYIEEKACNQRTTGDFLALFPAMDKLHPIKPMLLRLRPLLPQTWQSLTSPARGTFMCQGCSSSCLGVQIIDLSLSHGVLDETSQSLASFLAVKVSCRVTLVEKINKSCHVHLKVASFRVQIKPEPHPDCSSSGV